MKKLILSAIILTLLLTSCSIVSEQDSHIKYGISWEQYVTQDKDTLNVPFGFYSEYTEYTDGWCYDLTSSVYPDWTDDMINDFIFWSTEEFENKYKDTLSLNYKLIWEHIGI